MKEVDADGPAKQVAESGLLGNHNILVDASLAGDEHQNVMPEGHEWVHSCALSRFRNWIIHAIRRLQHRFASR